MGARYLAGRLVQACAVVFGATAIAFFLLNGLPGNVAVSILGSDASPSAYHQLDRALGLNKPIVTRYFDWFGNALHGNLGRSMLTNQPVAPDVITRLGVTLEVVFLATVAALVVAIVAATLLSLRPSGVFDRVVAALTSMSMAVPWFVSSLVLIYVFSVRLKILPTDGWVGLGSSVGENLKYCILPSGTLCLWLSAVFLRVLRADMVAQVEDAKYVETARMKGTSGLRLIRRHVLRNSLGSLVNVLGVNVGALLGATVIIEGIFGLPGVGSYLINAINQHDAPPVEGVVVVLAVLVVLLNLAADLVALALDPAKRKLLHRAR